MQNKANLLDNQINVSSILTKYYENLPLCTRGENKPKQTRSEFIPKGAEIPTGVLLGILKPEDRSGAKVPTGKLLGTLKTEDQFLSKLFLFFTFLYSSYNLAMQNWTIQKLLNWITEYLTGKSIDSPRLNAELLLSLIHGLKGKYG